MEATCSSKTLVDFQQTTWHYIPEDRTLQNRWSYDFTNSQLCTIYRYEIEKFLYTVSSVSLCKQAWSRVDILQADRKASKPLFYWTDRWTHKITVTGAHKIPIYMKVSINDIEVCVMCTQIVRRNMGPMFYADAILRYAKQILQAGL
jgi:hypothetical protein